MARGKTHVPTVESRAIVARYKAMGRTHEEVANELGINDDTLKKYYEEELVKGKTRAVVNMGGALYRAGINGNVTAMIFYLKTQDRWTEAIEMEAESTTKIRYTMEIVPKSDNDGN